MDVWSLLLGLWFGGIAVFITLITTGVPLPGSEKGLHAKATLTDTKTGEPARGWLLLLSIVLWPIILWKITRLPR